MRAQKRSILELRTVRRARLIALITASFHHNRCEARDEVELCEKAVPAARTFEEEIWKAVDRRILAPSRLAASAAALRVGVYEPSALQSALAEHGKALNKVLERLISQLPAAKEGARGLNVPNLLMHIRRQLTLAAPTRPDGTLQEGAARSCEALMTLPGFSERAVEAYTECFTSGWLPPALFAQLLTHHLHESVPALLRQPSHRLEWCLLGVQQVARALQGAAASQRNARHDSGGRSGMPPPLAQQLLAQQKRERSQMAQRHQLQQAIAQAVDATGQEELLWRSALIALKCERDGTPPLKFQAGVTKIQGWVERARRKKAEAEERKLQAGAEEEPQPSQLQRRHSHSGRFMGFEPAASARLPDPHQAKARLPSRGWGECDVDEGHAIFAKRARTAVHRLGHNDSWSEGSASRWTSSTTGAAGPAPDQPPPEQRPRSQPAGSLVEGLEYAQVRLRLRGAKRARQLSEALTRRNSGPAVVGEEVVGRSIEVYWPLDASWYAAQVICSKSNGRHQLLYSDGTRETVQLAKERWRWLQEAAAAPPGEGTAMSRRDSVDLLGQPGVALEAAVQEEEAGVRAAGLKRPASPLQRPRPKRSSGDLSPTTTTNQPCDGALSVPPPPIAEPVTTPPPPPLAPTAVPPPGDGEDSSSEDDLPLSRRSSAVWGGAGTASTRHTFHGLRHRGHGAAVATTAPHLP
ncbi:hypothetical protein EMIHUDRAFT_194577 [Emiliania huxleyi CCMP1516]|uniref:Tudor domain-containing protein n=2 Tax=Emiliania huxleyi TaxID=2903 RepID=A0A0D3L1S2_EMIH1|nr:hypothetical protein EMIHUDRAFT_194577 [Emiliania huxleyi CCMP1516]EOD41957.1 hypothetical protein EMIHUDRAFT_194577 [Emiliania huxleyi CCMP1516]|eukprot:XP_005794386.1 hypothetical protein EMIHUDRAFT_194577 [Emiliania huxleyi CCMP1516]